MKLHGATKTLVHRLIAALAWAMTTAALAQEHPTVGAWNGTGKSGSRIEIVVDNDRETGAVTGSWCFHFVNKGIRTNTLERSKARWIGRTVRWEQGETHVVVTPEPGGVLWRQWYWQKMMEKTKLTPMTTARCTDRFLFDAETPAADAATTQETTSNPIVGVWEGTWNRSVNRVGLVIESVDENGSATGRYCTRIINTEDKKHGNLGQMTLWDIWPTGRSGRVTENGELSFEIKWPKKKKTTKERFTFTPDNGVLHLAYKWKGKPWATGTLQRGHHELGCVHRTTPRPSGRSRPYEGAQAQEASGG